MNVLNPGERVSRLVLHWLAGTPEEPVQRWGIWEVTPAHAMGAILEQERVAGIKDSLLGGIWKALKGPDPRTLGHWAIVNKKRTWRTKSMVSREQWDLHKETGGYPLLCWIIEGEQGGHAWQFGIFEQEFLMAAGIDPELIQALRQAWPDPGSKPYAPYDNRVFKALAERDLLNQWQQARSWDARRDRTNAGLIVAGESEKRRREMQERMVRWLDNQIQDAVSDIPRRLLPAWSDFAPAQESLVKLTDEQLHSYIVEK